MMHISIYSIFWLLLYFGCISISSLSQSNGTIQQSVEYREGALGRNTPTEDGFSPLSFTWPQILNMIPSSFSIQLKKDKLDAGVNFNRKLLNTEKLIFKAEDNQDPMYVIVSVEPAGVVAIPHASERDFVMFNIVCDELLLGIPHRAWWVVGLVILCLVLAFVAPSFLPSFLLQNNQPFHSADPTISKDS